MTIVFHRPKVFSFPGWRLTSPTISVLLGWTSMCAIISVFLLLLLSNLSVMQTRTIHNTECNHTKDLWSDIKRFLVCFPCSFPGNTFQLAILTSTQHWAGVFIEMSLMTPRSLFVNACNKFESLCSSLYIC